MNLFEDLFGRESEYSASPEKIRNATEKEIAEYNRVMLTDHWRSMARETIEILGVVSRCDGT